MRASTVSKTDQYYLPTLRPSLPRRFTPQGSHAPPAIFPEVATLGQRGSPRRHLPGARCRNRAYPEPGVGRFPTSLVLSRRIVTGFRNRTQNQGRTPQSYRFLASITLSTPALLHVRSGQLIPVKIGKTKGIAPRFCSIGSGASCGQSGVRHSTMRE